MSVRIVRGKDKSFLVRCKSKKTGLPFDWTNLVSALIKIAKDGGTFLSLTLGSGITVEGAPELGVFRVNLEEAQTPELKKIASGRLEIEYEIGTAAANDPANFKDTIFIENALEIVKSQNE